MSPRNGSKFVLSVLGLGLTAGVVLFGGDDHHSAFATAFLTPLAPSRPVVDNHGQAASARSPFCLTSAWASSSEDDRMATGTSTRRRKKKDGESDEKESSAVKFSGAGPVQVDMNLYNLPLEEISQQWSANVVAETALQEGGVYIGSRDSKNILVDTVKVEFPRRPDEGMGIQLLELAGGREDGLGITVVSGLVEGGCADKSGIMEGDSVVKVALRKRTSQSLASDTVVGGGVIEKGTDELFSVPTECYGYDKTVEAILSLPPMEEDDEDQVYVLTLKRLRRKPKVKLTLQYPPSQNEPDTSIELFAGENLRRAMLVRGVKLNDALSRRFDNGGTGDCGAEGTCATCAVSVVRGDDLLNAQGTTEEQIFRDNPRWRLACKAIVGYGMREGELIVRVSPRQWG